MEHLKTHTTNFDIQLATDCMAQILSAETILLSIEIKSHIKNKKPISSYILKGISKQFQRNKELGFHNITLDVFLANLAHMISDQFIDEGISEKLTMDEILEKITEFKPMIIDFLKKDNALMAN